MLAGTLRPPSTSSTRTRRPSRSTSSLFARVPSALMLIAWAVAAAFGVAFVATALARRLDTCRRAGHRGRPCACAALPALAVAAFVFPFAIAILFGNLDAVFPLLYGLMLLGVLCDRPSARFGAGAALAIASIAKVHPASLALWFLVRGLAKRRGRSRRRATRLPPCVPRSRGLDGRRSLPEPKRVPRCGDPARGRRRGAGDPHREPCRGWLRAVAGLRRRRPDRRVGHAHRHPQHRTGAPDRAPARWRRGLARVLQVVVAARRHWRDRVGRVDAR